MDPYLSITAHWIDNEWKKREVEIRFELMTGLHTGEYLAEVFVKLLDDYGLLKSIFTITCDNASNMTRMAEYIERVSIEHPEISFKAGEHKISCISHIINLSVQAFLNKGLNSEPLEYITDTFSTVNMKHDVFKQTAAGHCLHI
ncbi:hypothetical protein INT44_007823 [Umbelopsis vinacea]|uniref:AC transposase n=1 Tax=Umbelopsis vinacea TaxID=44442 RepID=A0A8H7PKE5_9FUNG|nr:hypothetical protein INT44_007823 [Umbelopsis vinacea]